MSVLALAGIRKAVQSLNPGKVRELGERELNIALYAHTNEAYRRKGSSWKVSMNGGGESRCKH